MRRLIVAILASCLLCSCQRTKPQAPSHRSAQDTAQVALLLMTQRMAEEADKELTNYVNHIDSGYTLNEAGIWYRYTKRTNEKRWQKGENVLLHAQVYTMDGKLLIDSRETIALGKGETLLSIENILQTMRRNEACELLVPWYQAFGVSGSEEVPPYTNIKINMETYTTD